MAESNPQSRGPWPGGINNRAKRQATPEGAVWDSINFDPSVDGVLQLRPGFELVSAGAEVRGALSVGAHVLFADGVELRDFNADTGTTTTLREIAGAGRFAGAVMNEELFFCTENETLRYKAGVLRMWGVPTVISQPLPTIGVGGLQAGTYQIAATFLDGYGEEGGTTAPLLIQVPEGASLEFAYFPTPPPGGKVRLYASSVSGGELYLQYEGVGPYICSSIQDNSARLDTYGLTTPVPGDFIEAYNGCILIADGNVLHATTPLRPHLRSPLRGFFQFAKPIDGVLSADGGVFVAAEKTVFITGAETSEPVSASVFPYGAVRGSFVLTQATADQKERAAWMTQYGLAKSDGIGGAVLLSAQGFVPGLSESGSSGMTENNGNQLVVTTLRATKGPNPLAVSDHYEAEIVTP